MKKLFPYLAGLLVLGILMLLTFLAADRKVRQFDDRVTLNKQDKIPYGTYVAYQALGYLFPRAVRSINHVSPAQWDSLSLVSAGQALVVITPRFLANEEEMNRLLAFVQHGNDLFISTRMLSFKAQEMLHCQAAQVPAGPEEDNGGEDEDSLRVILSNPPFPPGRDYVYPGTRFSSYFNKYDTTITRELGRSEQGAANFIQLTSGRGHIFLHLAPAAFTNYFLLHKQNADYYAQVLSLISPGVTRLIWDEFYLRKRYEQDDGDNRAWLGVLLRFPAFRWGLLTALITLLVFIVLEMRRRQAYIPQMQPLRNESLDFVKTLGRLYYDRQDHRNLARKMAQYFLDHVRNRYKLPTTTLDNAFVQALHLKSGYPEEALQSIVSRISQLDTVQALGENQLAAFYKQLETFYQSTP